MYAFRFYITFTKLREVNLSYELDPEQVNTDLIEPSPQNCSFYLDKIASLKFVLLPLIFKNVFLIDFN